MRGSPVRELLRRRGIEVEPRYIRSLFPEQRAFVLDPSKTVANVSGRRSGKSTGKAARLLRAAEKHPGEMSLYGAQTKNNARMIVGRALMQLSRDHELGLTMKEIDGRLMCIHPNGHHMWLSGVPHRAAFEDFRGYKFAEIDLDEAQIHGPYLQEVCEEILEPSLGDLDGALVLSGTPSPLPIGYFHAVTTGLDTAEDGTPIPKFSTHSWTVVQNVYFRQGRGQEWLDEIRRRRGWKIDHPRFVREYLGQWVHDLESLVYPFDWSLNAWNEQLEPLPEGLLNVIAVDLGGSLTTPTTAFAALSYRRNMPELYVRECYKRAGMFPTAIAAEIEKLRHTYPTSTVVVDDGGLGGGYILEFNNRGVPAEAADKRSKLAFIELLRGDLKSGILKVVTAKCRDLIDEWAILQWNEEHTGIDDRFEDHASDATLYGSRAARPWYKPEIEGPKPGTREYVEAEMRRIKKAAERKVREMQQRKRRHGS